MVNRERIREEPAHDIVLGKLLDIQARLRGDPASAVPATRPIAVDLPDTVTVIHGDMRILSDRPQDVADAQVTELLERLAKLEAIIEEAGLLDEGGDGATVTGLPAASDALDEAPTEGRTAD